MRTLGTSTCLVLPLLPLLGGCEPGAYVAWEKDFQQSVNISCIEQSMRHVAPDVRRGSYVSDGNSSRGFPSGTVVTQFGYSDPTLIGYYNLEVATLPNGATRYWHGWGKTGTHVPDEERSKIIPLLNRVNDAVARDCGLTFEGAPR